MPLYEFKCTACEHLFELLMLNGARNATCPQCGSAAIEKLVSTFAAASDGQQQASTAKAYAYNNKLNAKQEPNKRRIQIEHKHQH
jgi:putative FmdB family regulatory protein